MGRRDQILVRIEKLKQSMPTDRPMRDSVVAHAGKDRAEIAFLYLSMGDEDSAAGMYVEGARWSQKCGDIIGALALVRQALRLRAGHTSAQELYRTLWALAGLGETPDSVD